MIRVNIDAFMSIEGAFPSELNVILFSRSDDGSKWLLLSSLLHPTTKHHNRLGVILVYICSGGEITDDSSLRAGLRLDTSAVCAETLLSINNRGRGLRQTARLEKGENI